MACLQRTLVVGAGIGGLATAIALRRRGIAVDVVEIQPKIEVYGVGIIQHGNVVREMASLGLLEKYLDKAYAFEDVGQYAADGTLLHRVTGHRLAGDRYPANVGISRLELHKVLVAVAEALGARISLGVTVESFLQDDGGVDVVLSDGMRDCYDLVVGADGVQSRMRALLFGEHLTPRLTGQSVWRYNFPRAPEVDHLATFSGPRGNAGLCPLADRAPA
jgi:2-polyprenyl-6-methoxyphenol hydroxylase-like FAD-dependent oxidoreductase